MTRVRGVDLARGLALLGMLVAHLDQRLTFDTAAPATWRHLGDGRAAVLFVLVAGVSVALLSGGTRPHEGQRLRDDRHAIFVRAAVLFVLGGLLSALGTPVAVILSAYALYFVLALPMLRTSPTVLAATGVALAAAGPFLLALVDQEFPRLESTAFGQLFVGAPYPAAVWIGFFLVGIALGRTTLRPRDDVRLWAGLALGGVAIAAIGYTLAPLVRDHLLTSRLPAIDPWLVMPLVEDDRSTNPFIALAALGVSVAVFAGCLAIPAGWWTTPLESVGRAALTIYVLHIAVYWIAIETQPTLERGDLALALWVMASAIVGATAWFLRFQRGPLEAALHRLSRA